MTELDQSQSVLQHIVPVREVNAILDDSDLSQAESDRVEYNSDRLYLLMTENVLNAKLHEDELTLF